MLLVLLLAVLFTPVWYLYTLLHYLRFISLHDTSDYHSVMELSRVRSIFLSLWNYATAVARTSDNSNTYWQSLSVWASEVLQYLFLFLFALLGIPISLCWSWQYCAFNVPESHLLMRCLHFKYIHVASYLSLKSYTFNYNIQINW